MASDLFNRANGAIGADWTDQLNAFLVVSNHTGVTTSGIDSIAFYNVGTWADDQTSKAILTLDGTSYAGVSVRASGTGGSSNGYVFLTNGAFTGLYKVSGGVFSLLTSSFSHPASGSDVKLGIVGTTLTAYDDGASIGGTSDATHASGEPGLYAFDSGTGTSYSDDWFGTGDTEPPPLDLSEDLIGHWPMNEAGANDDALDRRDSNDLTMRNDGGSNAGQNPIDSTPARDFEFDSENALVSAADAVTWSTDQAFTAIFRFKVESLNGRTYLEFFGKGNTDYDFLVYWFNTVGFIAQVHWGGAGNLNFNTATDTSVPTITLGDTYWIAVGHDPDTNTIWIKVNGNARVTDSHPNGTRHTSGARLVFGDADPVYTGTSHDGGGGPATLWHRNLTDAEIDSYIAVDGNYDDFVPRRTFILTRL